MSFPNVGLRAVRGVTPSEFSLSDHKIVLGCTIASAARDARNTSKTTTLRPGLMLGKITASGKFAQYDPSAIDGTEVAAAILNDQVRVIDDDANAVDAAALRFIHGVVSEAKLIGCDAGAKADLAGQIIFEA